MLKIFANRGKGSVTVFVTLIMIPTVFFTAFLGDLARIKLYSNIALMSADNYAESILTEYDDLLRELYGFYSVTQNKEALAALDQLKSYSMTSFKPEESKITYQYLQDPQQALGLNKYDGMMPYSGADVTLSHEFVEDANLNDREVFATQLGDFMRFRIAQALLMSGDIDEESGELGGDLLKMKEEVAEHEGDMKAIDAQQDFADVLQEYTDLISEYYEYLYLLEEEYDKYHGRYSIVHGETVDQYNELLRSDEYKEYQIIKSLDKDADKKQVLKDAIEKKNKGDDLSAEEQELYDMNERFDDNKKKIDNFMSNGSGYLESARAIFFTYSTTKMYGIPDENWTKLGHKKGDDHHINMERFDTCLNKLNTLSGKIEAKSKDVIAAKNKWVDALNAKKENGDYKVSKEMREAETTKECLKRVEDITNPNTVKLFKEVYNYINDNDKTVNEKLKVKYSYEKKAFEAVDTLIKNGEIEPYNDIQVTKIKEYDEQVQEANGMEASFKSIRSVPSYKSFYDKLSEGFNWDFDVEAKKKEAEEQKKEGQGKVDKANSGMDEEKKKDEEDAKKTRSIPSSYDFGGNTGGDDSDLKQMMSKVGDLISTGDWGNAGNETLLKVYAIEYDFGMFSSRVTEVRKEAEKNGENEDESMGSKILDNATGTSSVSLTGYEKRKEINYLYGAELEYVIHGSKNTKDNLSYTRNIICGFRMIMNFCSSYSISAVSGTIEAVSEPLNAVPFVGPALAIAVNILLRLGFAALETYAEWQSLMRGEKVLLYKKDVKQLDALDLLKGWIPGLPDVTDKEGFGLTYEQYLLIFMIFLTSSDHLYARTENLIELNMNAVIEEVGASGNLKDDYANAAFKMANAHTAVETTCDVHMDFAIVPDGFAKAFLGAKTNNSTPGVTYEEVKDFEKTIYEYKIIRGY